MSKSLKRLLTLRERLKKAAEGNLHATHSARDKEVACTEQAPLGQGAAAVFAGELLELQQRRDASYLRIAQLDRVVIEQQLQLNTAKRELRQVEKLLEGATDRQDQRLQRRELREQEDWVRAKSHKEKQP